MSLGVKKCIIGFLFWLILNKHINGGIYGANCIIESVELNKVRIVLPFKDQIAANTVRRQLRDPSNKIAVTLQPIFVSKKMEEELKPKGIAVLACNLTRNFLVR